MRSWLITFNVTLGIQSVLIDPESRAFFKFARSLFKIFEQNLIRSFFHLPPDSLKIWWNILVYKLEVRPFGMSELKKATPRIW